MKLTVEVDLGSVWGDDYGSLAEIIKATVENSVQGEVRRMVKSELQQAVREFVSKSRAEIMSKLAAAMEEVDLRELVSMQVKKK